MIEGAVVDLSHYEDWPLDFRAAADAGVLGVIHKATQGLDFRDSTYALHKRQATSAGVVRLEPGCYASGLLWGAYHFLTNADGAAQADYFLAVTNPDAETLVAVDYERQRGVTPATLEQLYVFVERVNVKLGRYPVLYSGDLIKEEIGPAVRDPILANCPLWLAQYAAEPAGWSTATFPVWSLWQDTDGHLGPRARPTPGLGRVDTNCWNGSVDGLRRLWGVTATADGPYR